MTARSILIALHVIILSFFLGQMFIWTLPGIPGLAWPYSIITGYSLGALLSVLITFFIFRKLRVSMKHKIVIAGIVFVVLIAASYTITLWLVELAKIRAAELLGLVS